jgi:SNF2 family DNA or RNA helicase
MLLLQASLLGEDLVLWGEQPAAAPLLRRPGRRPAGAPSPFDPGLKSLRRGLRAALPQCLPGAQGLAVWAWLPATASGPMASSPLIDANSPRGQVTLGAFAVTGLQLKRARWLDLLGAVLGRDTLIPGVVIGSTLTWWAAALRFAAALVARQQVVPGLHHHLNIWRACWQPVLAGADVVRAAALARAMPPACRALNYPGTVVPPDVPAPVALNTFLETSVDTLVRSAARTDPVTTLVLKVRRSTLPSLHDQWTHALGSVNPRLTASEEALQRLAAQIRDWRRPLATTAAPYRLCFRLEEPPQIEGEAPPPPGADTRPWQLRYLIQAADDLSLQIPLADLWSGRGPTALLRRGGVAPREFALAALGQAAALDEDIAASLSQPAPAGVELDLEAAYRFLSERAARLEAEGFGVFLPSWWTRQGTRQRLALRALIKPEQESTGSLLLENLVDFRWQIALGDQDLTLEELQGLARLKAPLVRVRGQWVQLSGDEIRAAVEFWKKRTDRKVTVREALRLALGVERLPLCDLTFEGVRAEGAFADLLAQLQGRSPFRELPTPEGFTGTLRPYQLRGYSWLAFLGRFGLGACLADDMGLGKTVQTLALIQHQWRQQQRPTLLVCPLSVVGNWNKEARRFTPDLPVLIHHGTRRLKGEALRQAAAQQGLVVSSYGLLHRDLKDIESVDWAGVVLDEAQNIKNAQTRQSQAARSLKSLYRIALTGTPVENHVGDLWSLLDFLNPGLLGSESTFRNDFFIPIQLEQDAEAAAYLKRLTGPFILRRLKTDPSIISDLPAKLEAKVYCNLTREQASLYAAVLTNLTEALETAVGMKRRGLILAALTRLKQVCNHPTQFLGDNSSLQNRSGKLTRLTEMLEEVQTVGERALIFSQFTEMGFLLQRHLQDMFGREVLFLHGGIPKPRRDTMVERFQDGDGPRLFVLSLKAGGTGLNLTAANHVFHYDRWWNPATEDQATDRAFRIGQKKRVQVHKFICAGTLEDRIDDMITRKQQIAGMTVGSGESWLTELSTADLRELFALRTDAMAE